MQPVAHLPVHWIVLNAGNSLQCFSSPYQVARKGPSLSDLHSCYSVLVAPAFLPPSITWFTSPSHISSLHLLKLLSRCCSSIWHQHGHLCHHEQQQLHLSSNPQLQKKMCPNTQFVSGRFWRRLFFQRKDLPCKTVAWILRLRSTPASFKTASRRNESNAHEDDSNAPRLRVCTQASGGQQNGA